MSDDEQSNILVRTEHNLWWYLSFCNDPTMLHARGKQIWRGIGRGTQPNVVPVWLIIWILATQSVTLHERLVNMFVGTVVGLLLCSMLLLVFKRPRPIRPGGTPSTGLAKYTFPNDDMMIFTLAYNIATAGNPDVIKLMKIVFVVTLLVQIILGRAYISDILGGVLLAMIVYQLLVRFLWISPNASEPIIKSVQAALHLYR